jgi:hypothetical protein
LPISIEAWQPRRLATYTGVFEMNYSNGQIAIVVSKSRQICRAFMIVPGNDFWLNITVGEAKHLLESKRFTRRKITLEEFDLEMAKN